ncbi:MAG: class I SAM-dependent methyltransferase [Roseburia sp.]|nr:class I SAM-dependent methyltransferase [Roseburia sp.]
MEKDFTYAHRDTSTPERESRTAGLNKLRVSDQLARLRRYAQTEWEVPTVSDETLNFLLTLALAKNPKNILEVGCADGLTSCALLDILPDANLTGIEREEKFICSFKSNLHMHAGRHTVICGDATDICKALASESYDFIFLDCAKVQYIKLLPDLKRILKKNGVLVADDVLMYGWVNGEVETPKKRKMLVEHIREYITAVTYDGELQTSVLDVGNGVALSVKK